MDQETGTTEEALRAEVSRLREELTQLRRRQADADAALVRYQAGELILVNLVEVSREICNQLGLDLTSSKKRVLWRQMTGYFQRVRQHADQADAVLEEQKQASLVRAQA